MTVTDGRCTTASTLAALANVATDLCMYMYITKPIIPDKHLTIAANSLLLAHNAGHSTSIYCSPEDLSNFSTLYISIYPYRPLPIKGSVGCGHKPTNQKGWLASTHDVMHPNMPIGGQVCLSPGIAMHAGVMHAGVNFWPPGQTLEWVEYNNHPILPKYTIWSSML